MPTIRPNETGKRKQSPKGQKRSRPYEKASQPGEHENLRAVVYHLDDCKKNGRPIVYHPSFDECTRKQCLLGAKDLDIARFYGVELKTILRWKTEFPSFCLAIEAGRESADATIADSLYHRARGYSHDAVKIFMPSGAKEPVYAHYVEHYPPDTAAAIIWLKNRNPDKWRDYQRHTLDVTIKDDLSPEVRRLMDIIADSVANQPALIEGTATPVEDEKPK